MEKEEIYKTVSGVANNSKVRSADYSETATECCSTDLSIGISQKDTEQDKHC